MNLFIIYLTSFILLFALLNLSIYICKNYVYSLYIIRKTGFNQIHPSFSIDELIYFVTFPTNLSHLQEIDYHQIKISYDIESLLTFEPKGMNISIKIDKHTLFPIAYLHFDRVLIPDYMVLHYEKKITNTEREILQQQLFYSKIFRNHVKSEVHKKLSQI